jgi:Xaa-Pro aminopeptidase
MSDTIDRRRAQSLMEAAGLDALILFQPEHVSTALDVSPGVAALFRRAGAASALVPVDPRATIAAVMPDLAAGATRAAGTTAEIAYHRIWVDTATVQPHGPDEPLSGILSAAPQPLRPANFDARAAFGLLGQQLRARGLQRGRLGADLGFVPAADLALLVEVLPDATIVDGTDTIRRLRMVKTPVEIARLRAAVELSEIGLQASLAAIRKGVEPQALSAAYAEAVRTAAAARGLPIGLWDYISVGPDPWGVGRPAEAGDILKVDVGVVVRGYSSDMARTVAFGKPSRAARELHAALLGGLEAGLSRLGPGVRLAEVHAAMLAAVRARGVPGYARGHFGHSLGNDPFSEQWPFIAADSDVAAEPGMVLAVESPYYVDGLGGFIIEDQVLVTAGGIELMSRHPRELAVYG